MTLETPTMGLLQAMLYGFGLVLDWIVTFAPLKIESILHVETKQGSWQIRSFRTLVQKHQIETLLLVFHILVKTSSSAGYIYNLFGTEKKKSEKIITPL